MAPVRFPLVAEECTWPLRRQFHHLRAFSDGFRQFQLARIDAFQIIDARRSSCGAAFGGRSERPQMNVLDPGLGETIPQRSLGKAGTAGVGNCTNVDNSLDSCALKRGDEFGNRRAFVADGENLHCEICYSAELAVERNRG